jgi:hypothetical protein
MEKLKKVILLSIVLAITAAVFSQTLPSADAKGLSIVGDYKIQERVLLITDQNLYLAGEPVNFYANTFDAALHIPIDFSSILYLEFYDQEKNVVVAQKFHLKKGECINHFTLPRQLNTGYYYIRAYTNYMKNFGASAFFTQKLRIVNPFYKINYQENTDTLKKFGISISPEGGKLLYGINNKIALYSTNLNDSAKVALYNNDLLVAKSNINNGFGIINFTPTPKGRYRIEALNRKKEKATVELTDIKQAGVICKLDSVNGNSAFLRVEALHFNGYPISVYVDNNHLLYKSNSQISSSGALLKIELPAGINKVILKDKDQQLISERLVYIKPQKSFDIHANLNYIKSPSGDSATISVGSNNIDTVKYVVAFNLGNQNTSQRLTDLMEKTIASSSLGFTSDISTLEKLQYFCNDIQSINNYILKFNSAVFTSKLDAVCNYLPEIQNDIVTGHVERINNHTSAPNRLIYLSFVDSISNIVRGQTDSSGKFSAMLPIDNQNDDLVLSVRDSVDKYAISLDNEFYPEFLQTDKAVYYPDSTLKEIIESRMLNIQINDAYSESQKQDKLQRSDVRFYGLPDYVYKVKKYLVPNLAELLTEIVQNTTLVKNGLKTEIRVFLRNEHRIIGDNPLIVLDGIPLLESKNLLLSPTEKLETVKLLCNQFFFGSEVYDGIVDITSKKRAFDLINPDQNSIRTKFSQVITEKEHPKVEELREPFYKSDVCFEMLRDFSRNTLKFKLPYSSGTYSMFVVGFDKNGHWSLVELSSFPKKLQ